MSIIKIPNVGDSHTMKVVRCEVVQGNYNEQVKFSGDNGDELFLPRSSADRQLLRLGFGEGEGESALVGYGDVDGHILTFYRAANPKDAKKPFWNIKRDSEAEPTRGKPEAPMSAPRSQTPAKAEPAKQDAPTVDFAAMVDGINRAYAHAWQVAVKVQGDESSSDSLQAGAATLFIAYQNRGLLTHFVVPPKAEEKPAPAKAPAKPQPDLRDEAEVEYSDDLPFS